MTPTVPRDFRRVTRGSAPAYVAAPLFNDAEKTFNLLLDARLHTAGPDTYLPQRDGGEATETVRRGLDEATVRRELFYKDVAAVAACDLFVFVLDGRVPDEGACVELGLAHARNKPCFGLQIDSRRFGGPGTNNLMIDDALDRGIGRTLDELVTAVTMSIASNTPASGHRLPVRAQLADARPPNRDHRNPSTHTPARPHEEDFGRALVVDDRRHRCDVAVTASDHNPVPCSVRRRSTDARDGRMEPSGCSTWTSAGPNPQSKATGCSDRLTRSSCPSGYSPSQPAEVPPWTTVAAAVPLRRTVRSTTGSPLEAR